MNVTVDLEDLETLVFATGAIKVIEGILVVRKNDPWIKSVPEITAAQ